MDIAWILHGSYLKLQGLFSQQRTLLLLQKQVCVSRAKKHVALLFARLEVASSYGMTHEFQWHPPLLVIVFFCWTSLTSQHPTKKSCLHLPLYYDSNKGICFCLCATYLQCPLDGRQHQRILGDPRFITCSGWGEVGERRQVENRSSINGRPLNFTLYKNTESCTMKYFDPSIKISFKQSPSLANTTGFWLYLFIWFVATTQILNFC